MSVAVAANALMTWAEYKIAVNVTTELDDEQDRYQDLINKASSRIELYTRRKLKATDYTSTAALILDGGGGDTLIVPHYPVNSVTKLYCDSSRAFTSAYEVVSTDYKIYIESGLIKLYSGTFPNAPASVKIECNAGYASTTAEYSVLQTACFELIRWMNSRYGSTGAIGMIRQSNADGMSSSWETELPMNIKTMLEPFRAAI